MPLTRRAAAQKDRVVETLEVRHTADRIGPKQSLISASQECIDDDDLCYICHTLLLNPVKTSCSHVFCNSCFSHWAEVSFNTMIVDLDPHLPVDVLGTVHDEARCPMCRKITLAALDTARVKQLEGRYPLTYARRAQEMLDATDSSGTIMEPIVLHIGNEHSKRCVLDAALPARTELFTDSTDTMHNWKFFVRPSRTDVIEEVQIFMPIGFRPRKIVIQWPPYILHREGSSSPFEICANVILKPGYSWVSDEAEDTIDGAVKGKLPLSWSLVFNGAGSMGRMRLRIKREKDQDRDDENEREMQRARRLWTKQRDADPDYVPPPDD